MKMLFMLLLLAGCVDVELGIHETCGVYVDAKSVAHAFCGDYDFDRLKYVGRIKDVPAQKINGGFILTKGSWLVGLRPKLKELLRERVDSKKKGNKLFIDGFLDHRSMYSLE